MKTTFNGFEQYITQHLEGIESPKLEEVQDKLAAQQRSVDGLYNRPILSMPIVEDTHRDDVEVENIQVVNDSTPTGNIEVDEEGKKRKKNKIRKRQRTKKEEVVIAIRESLQSERD